MPKKSALVSEADRHPAPGGAAAVDRALSLLVAFRHGDDGLTLAELAQRTGLYKSTALRLLASLEHAHWLLRRADGRYVLGPEPSRLHTLYTDTYSLESEVVPALRELVACTRESAAFHVRQGQDRVCLYRVDSPQLLRDHTRAGDRLPLDRGAGGRVLTAYDGASGALYAQIRRDGVITLSGDRVSDLTGVSAPVFGPHSRLIGALTLTLPSHRLMPHFSQAVREAAGRLTQRLGGAPPR